MGSKKRKQCARLRRRFDRRERQDELKAALENGTQVVFVMAVEKKIHFFGWRSLYLAYLSHGVETLAAAANFSAKRSKKLTIDRPLHPLASYFKQLGREGWTLCGSAPESDDYVMLASTPEKKALGLEIEVEGKRSWLVSPRQRSNDCALISSRAFAASSVRITS